MEPPAPHNEEHEDDDDDAAADNAPKGWIAPDRRKWIHPAELNRAIRAFAHPPPRPPLSPQEQAWRGALTSVALVSLIIGILLLSSTRHSVEQEPAHGWLGVSVQQEVKDHSVAEVVVAVMSNGPATGRLHLGDVIESVDHHRVRSISQLAAMVRDVPPGQMVWLEVERSTRTGPQMCQVALAAARAP